MRAISDSGGAIRVSRSAGFRNAPAMVRDPAGHLAALGQQHGDCFIYPFGGLAPTLVVSRPSIAQHVLKRGEASFAKSDIQTRYMLDFLGSGLLTLHGDEWRQRRRTIAHGFRPERLNLIAPGLAQDVQAGLAAVAKRAAGAPVDVAAEMTRLTFIAVARTLLGAAMTEAEIASISTTITSVQAFLVRRIVFSWADPWFRLSGAHARHQAMRRAGDAIVAAHVDRRLASGPSSDGDMLDLLIAAGAGEHGHMGRDAIVAEIMQLLVAGHETSSTVLGWTLWLLARHPQVLAQLRAEFAAFGDGGLEADAPVRLPFAAAVLKEAMRLYPPFWMVDRVALEDSEVDGVSIPRGMRIAVFIYGLHRRADIWADPDDFRPARFLGEERANERTGGYLPFGSGPRTCVGSVYAMLQMLTILRAVLSSYDVTVAAGNIRPQALLILRARHGIPMRLVPIS